MRNGGYRVKINKVTLNIQLKTAETVNLGMWQGAKIRSAIIAAVARRYCDSPRYSECDICKVETCMNKYLFHYKQDKQARMASNPIIVECEFNNEEVWADEFSIKIHLFNPATEYQDDIVEILEQGIYLGTPKIRFQAIEIIEETKVLDISIIDEKSDKTDSLIEINFETPFVTNGKSGVTHQQIIRSCTTRVTSMVNTVGVDYRVPYEKAIEAANKIQLVKVEFNPTVNSKQSTRTNRYDYINGVTGKMVLRGDFSDIYHFLEIASELNIGKECTMGFGKFTVKEVKD